MSLESITFIRQKYPNGENSSDHFRSSIRSLALLFPFSVAILVAIIYGLVELLLLLI